MSHLCKCGCGKETSVALRASARLNVRKGDHYRFIAGHQRRKRCTPEEALPFKIDGIYCRFIALPDGLITVVEEQDYRSFAAYSWHLKRNRDGKIYVVRKGLAEDGERGSQVAMHRQILGLKPGDPREGDHANRNTLDNRRSNLRIAADSENARNSKIRKDNTSGYKGVAKHGNMWRYRIWTDDGRKTVGGFKTPEEAFLARCERVRSEHHEFGRIA